MTDMPLHRPDFVSRIPAHETVLAIDPGNIESAFLRLSGAGQILEFGKVPTEEMLRIAALPSDHRICEAIVSYGMPAGKSLFDTCTVIGMLIERCRPSPVLLIPRLEVKLAICRSPRANDSSIRTALLDLYGPPGKKAAPGPTFGITADVWSALAIGTTFLMGGFRPYELSK